MAKITVQIPDIAQVVVTGPVQSGKSIVLARIEKMLREEFGAATVSRDLDIEKRLSDTDNPPNWAVASIGRTMWVLSEA